MLQNIFGLDSFFWIFLRDSYMHINLSAGLIQIRAIHFPDPMSVSVQMLMFARYKGWVPRREQETL